MRILYLHLNGKIYCDYFLADGNGREKLLLREGGGCTSTSDQSVSISSVSDPEAMKSSMSEQSLISSELAVIDPS